MIELLLVCAVAAIIVFGYIIMKKLDDFLANNRRLIDTEIAENSLSIAFDNPMILDSLMPLFEGFSKANPNCQFHFLFGNTEDIYDKLNKNRIDFGFIENTASANDDTYNGGADKILDYADRPSFCLYSSGLSPPREILIRFSRYQTI